MNYKETLAKIREYLVLHDFRLDEKYISIRELKMIIGRRISIPFSVYNLIDSINNSIEEYIKQKHFIYRRKYLGIRINDIVINIDKNEVLLHFITKKGAFDIIKERNDAPYIDYMYPYVNTFNEINYNATLINDKMEKLEHIYDLLKLEDIIKNEQDINLFKNYKSINNKNRFNYNDGFFNIVFLLDEKNNLVTKFDLVNDINIKNKDKVYLGETSISEILENSKETLEEKIKIPISILPDRLKVLVEEENEKKAQLEAENKEKEKISNTIVDE